METFLPLVQDRVYSQDPNNRMFIVSWIQVLEAMPDLNMIVYLPTLLEGLFQYVTRLYNSLPESHLRLTDACLPLQNSERSKLGNPAHV